MMYFDENCAWLFRLEQDPAFKGPYIAAMGVCQDPSCPCTVATIACREAEPADDVPPENIRFVFSLDLTTRKLVNISSEERPPESARFARAFVKELEEKTWIQLRDIFLSAKRRLSEHLNPDTVRYHRFDAGQIENENLMVSYISVFPFEDKLSFTCDSRNYLVNDYYCLNSSCTCKDVHLVFHEAPAGKRSSKHAPIAGSLTYS